MHNRESQPERMHPVESEDKSNKNHDISLKFSSDPSRPCQYDNAATIMSTLLEEKLKVRCVPTFS